MDKNQRLDTYLSLIQGDFSDFLQSIEKKALENRVPIIRKQSQYFLRFMMQLVKPREILEIGTAVGFSGLLMLESNPEMANLDTIESFKPRIEEAEKNIKNSGREDRIHLYKGDAMEILPTLDKKYDFIFMDASKGQYINMLPLVKELMHTGTVFVTDNIMQEGDLIESNFAVKRRNRTIHKRMREFLEVISKDEDFVTDTLPIGDGMTVAVRK